MKKINLLFLCIIIASIAGAQVDPLTDVKLKGNGSCGFDQVLQKAKIDYAQLLDGYRAHAAASRQSQNTAGLVYDIPVVFHVVYAANQSSLNINDSILINQIDVLNKAYRKRHADTANTRSIFKPLSMDAEIQFHLATKDPAGKPTNGITRTISKRTFFGSTTPDLDSLDRVKKTAEGGIDPWPTTKYLNIWICNMTDSKGQLSVLGYAVPPLNPLPPNWPTGIDFGGIIDGVVLQTHAVGSNNPLSAALQGIYTKGRAAVHEVGHYLGLQHVFGSTAGNSTADCGTALITDGMADTPEQALISQVKGCPPADKNSCGAGTAGDLPDMWENYMDYATDACQTLFTKDQVALMRSVLDDQRSTLFDVTGMDEMVAAAATIYPNPATDAVTISYAGKLNKITVINYMGQPVLEFSGNDLISSTYNISSLTTGTYLFLLESANGSIATTKCQIIR
jgi:hypothetical protein